MEVSSHNLARESQPRRIILMFACFCSLIILFTVPIEEVHHFAAHFRTGEVRRSLERHTAHASDDAPPSDPRPRREIVSAPIIMPILCADTAHAYTLTAFTEIPITRLLSRLKVGSHSDSDHDSLS